MAVNDGHCDSALQIFKEDNGYSFFFLNRRGREHLIEKGKRGFLLKKNQNGTTQKLCTKIVHSEWCRLRQWCDCPSI